MATPSRPAQNASYGYHCYVLNKEGRISSRHDIEAESDVAVVLRARSIIELSDDYPAIEIWQNARIVGRIER